MFPVDSCPSPPPPLPQVVLLLDALDEADPPEEQLAANGGPPACPTICGNKALQLLVKHLARLPDCVRFVVTTRPEAAWGQVLRCLQRTFARGREGGGGGTVLPVSSLLNVRETASAAEAGGRRSGSGKRSGNGGGDVDGGSAACGSTQSCGDDGGGGTGSSSSHVGGVLLYHAVAAKAAELGCEACTASAATSAPTLEDVYGMYEYIFKTSYASLASSPDDLGKVEELVAVVMAAKE
jgi:hypothetical protein